MYFSDCNQRVRLFQLHGTTPCKEYVNYRRLTMAKHLRAIMHVPVLFIHLHILSERIAEGLRVRYEG